jgi:hypothetical protein
LEFGPDGQLETLDEEPMNDEDEKLTDNEGLMDDKGMSLN